MGCVVEQDSAQDGLFRIEIRWQAGLEREVGDGGHRKECRAKSPVGKAVRIPSIIGKLGNQTGLQTAREWRRFRVAAGLVATAKESVCFSGRRANHGAVKRFSLFNQIDTFLV